MAKYYIKYRLEGKEVKKEFDTIPKGIYYAAGYQDRSDKGKAFVTKLTDSGTTLIPLMVIKTNKQYKRK